MRIAVLGYGSIAEEHLAALRALREQPANHDLAVSWVMGRVQASADDFARRYDIPRATTSLASVLADSAVEAVVITSPSELHAEQTAASLRAGKHVLCEIPLATSLAETDQLIALAEQVGRRVMVCHTQRYFPALIEARRLVASGELHLHNVVSRYMFPRRNRVNWLGKTRSWTDNLLWHHGCHAVDAALFVLGADQVEVSAQVALPGGELGIPMDLSVLLRTPRDQLVSVAMSYNTHLPVHDYLFIGQETTVLFEGSNSPSGGSLRDRERTLVAPSEQGGLEHPIARQNAEFFAALREDREPAVSAHAVRPTMAALQAAQDSLNARLASLGANARHPDLP